MFLSTSVVPNCFARFWIETRMKLVERTRAVEPLSGDTRPAALGDSAILLLGPGLPIDLLLVSNDGILPRAGRQLERFGFGDRHSSQLRAVGLGQAPTNHRTPCPLQLRQRIDQQCASQCGDNLAPFAR